MGLLPNWFWLQFPSFGCVKFVNRQHTLSQVCLLFSHLARAKSENFASKPIRQQTQLLSQTGTEKTKTASYEVEISEG